MRLLKPEGILVPASCSMHLERAKLTQLLQEACRKNGRMGQVLEQGGQGAGHPVHPAIPETEYFKSVILRTWYEV